jgi:hypothetical protein
LALLASFEFSRHTQLLTRFTYEIFGCYVCSVYVYSGVKGVLASFNPNAYEIDNDNDNDDRVTSSFVVASALFLCLIAGSTLGLSLLFSSCAPSADPDTRHPSWSERADRNSSSGSESESPSLLPGGEEACCRWTICAPLARSFFADYAVTIAVFIATLCSYVPAWSGVSTSSVMHIDRVYIPHSVSGGGDEDKQGWLVDFSQSDSHELTRTLFVSALVALPIAFFFFIDQSLSALLSQHPHMTGMKKGVYLHAPLFLVAVCNMVGPSLGLPFVTASLPHSPQLVEALSSPSECGRVKCSENRVAPLLVYLLILGSATLPALTPLVRCIPTGAVRGVHIM